MRYYYITICWDNINSVTQKRVVPVVANSVDEAIKMAIGRVSKEHGKFNVHAQAYHIVN